MFKVFEYLSRVEDLNVAVNQHRHLALGVNSKHFRMLRFIAKIVRKRNHDEVDKKSLLQRRDVRLRAEHAEGSGIERHMRRCDESFRRMVQIPGSNIIVQRLRRLDCGAHHWPMGDQSLQDGWSITRNDLVTKCLAVDVPPFRGLGKLSLSLKARTYHLENFSVGNFKI